ncbi:hypothetical protein GF407_10920 [candidate division KSB1 bacterium]|nr:hypothetical protein [candidate division KSB1 bacterium]
MRQKNLFFSKRIAAVIIGLMLLYNTLLPAGDWRNIRNGREIPSKTYADQPYIVKTDDGAWLCIITTGAGLEGEAGQHVITMRSKDQGKSWSKPVALEPADGPEASYAVLLKTPYGRIYRQFGWGRLNPNMRHANGSQYLKIDNSVTSLKIFNRYLRTSEAIALYKSSQSAQP